MNNSFRQCISQICGLELSSLSGGSKYSVFDNRVAVVEGHGGIVDYLPQKVSFLLGKGRLEICGENLKLKCLEKHYAVLEGKICSVAVSDD